MSALSSLNVITTLEKTFQKHHLEIHPSYCATDPETSLLHLDFSFKRPTCDTTLYCSVEAYVDTDVESNVELTINHIMLDGTPNSHNSNIFYPTHRFWHPYPYPDIDTSYPRYILSPQQFVRGLIMAYTSEANLNVEL